MISYFWNWYSCSWLPYKCVVIKPGKTNAKQNSKKNLKMNLQYPKMRNKYEEKPHIVRFVHNHCKLNNLSEIFKWNSFGICLGK